MVETYVARVHPEPILLDIGNDIGALIVYTEPEYVGREIEVSLPGQATRTHTVVHERLVNGRTIFAGVFPALTAGDYIIWSAATQPFGVIAVAGGHIAEVDWRGMALDLPAMPDGVAHPHEHTSPARPPVPPEVMAMLPPRYRQGQPVRSTPMGAAPLRYAEDGQVAWNEMWTDFCDLALAGGPSHRGSLLEPVDPQQVAEAPDDYERVVAEIERGLRLVTGLPTPRSSLPGWVGLQCESETMALWMLHAVMAENVTARRDGAILYLPAGPYFCLEKEIKNVVTAVAKTHHYWMEHRNSQ